MKYECFGCKRVYQSEEYSYLKSRKNYPHGKKSKARYSRYCKYCNSTVHKKKDEIKKDY